MEKLIKNEELFEGKDVLVKYNSFTGKIIILINGMQAQKIKRNTYEFEGQTINFKGNFITGAKLIVKDKEYEVSEKQPIYVSFIAILPFVFDIVLSSIPAVGKAGFPLVGGAIGGAISGVMCFVSLYCMTLTKKHLFKVLIGLGFVALNLLICLFLGFIILSLIAK